MQLKEDETDGKAQQAVSAMIQIEEDMGAMNAAVADVLRSKQNRVKMEMMGGEKGNLSWLFHKSFAN